MLNDLTLAAGARKLPRGRHGLSQEEVVLSQRGRLLQAMAEAVAEKGYASTTVADVLSRARVSRSIFYELFADKEHCYLSAYEAASRLHLRWINEAASEETDWLSSLRTAHRAYLEALAAGPAFARAFVIEVHSAGPRALELREQVLGRFVRWKQQSQQAARAAGYDVPDLPEEAFWGSVGATDAIVAGAIRRGELAELPRLLPVLVYLDLATLVGEDVARTELSA